MNKFFLTLAFSSILLLGNAPAASAQARIDVIGSKDGGALEPGRASDGGYCGNANWIKDPPGAGRQVISSGFAAEAAWKECKLSFTPERDGKADVVLLGGWSKGAPEVWVFFDDVSAEGAEIRNGDFEGGVANWALVGVGKKASVVEGGEKGSNAMRVSHSFRASQTIDVKGGRQVVLKFRCKLAGQEPRNGD
jgi:hypothetical protein